MNDLRSTSTNGATQPSSSDATDTAGALKTAGRKLFATHGFDGASVRAITHEAGANLGAITYHFGSKRGLYAAVLDDGIRPLADRVVAAADSPGTPLDRILLVVQAYFEHFRKNPDLPRLLLQEISAGRRPPDVVIDLVQRIAGTIRRLQEEGEADGSLRVGDPFLTAPSVVAQPIFLTLVTPLFREITGLDLKSPEMNERMISHTLAFIRAGLAPGGKETS